MSASARVHLIQIELSGDKPRLHATCVREVTDGKSKVNAGTCEIQFDVTAAKVKPLLDKIKAELAKRVALPKGQAEDVKQFKGLTLK